MSMKQNLYRSAVPLALALICGGPVAAQATKMQSGDLEAQQHWVSSGFANTDLNLLLSARGIDHVVLAGVRANDCQLRDASELRHSAALSRNHPEQQHDQTCQPSR